MTRGKDLNVKIYAENYLDQVTITCVQGLYPINDRKNLIPVKSITKAWYFRFQLVPYEFYLVFIATTLHQVKGLETIRAPASLARDFQPLLQHHTLTRLNKAAFHPIFSVWIPSLKMKFFFTDPFPRQPMMILPSLIRKIAITLELFQKLLAELFSSSLLQW